MNNEKLRRQKLNADELKRDLRARVLREAAAMDPAVLAAADEAAARALLSSQVWRDAKSVALFVSRPGEINTAPLLENAWRTGKIVLLPQIADTTAKRMFLARAAGPADLVPGAYGIPAPARKVEKQEIFPELLILPGVAFDESGNRLGYGAGFYDRFFGANIAIVSPRVGFCRRFQVVPEIPATARDYPVNALCDEEGFKWL